MVLNEKEERMLVNKISKMVCEALSEKNSTSDVSAGKNGASVKVNDRSENDSNKEDKKEKKHADVKKKLKAVISMIDDTNDDEVHTFNLTRSQLAYELYPNLDKDSARSKLSQKILGRKNFTLSEINKLYNIITSDIA